MLRVILLFLLIWSKEIIGRETVKTIVHPLQNDNDQTSSMLDQSHTAETSYANDVNRYNKMTDGYASFATDSLTTAAMQPIASSVINVTQ